MRLIVGISGASGVGLGLYLIKALRAVPDCEIFLIVSECAQRNWSLEMNQPIEDLYRLADAVYDNTNMAAPTSSGSFASDGMIVIPCSMKTLAGIATGYAENLIMRSVDVCLKESRKVVLVTRETPLNRIHLRNMKEAADAGCIILPPVLTFYSNAQTLEDQINHIVGKVLMQFGIVSEDFVPWTGADT